MNEITNHSASTARLIDIMLANEEEEFLTYAPEYKENFIHLSQEMMLFRMMLGYTWSRYKDLSTVKEVALAMETDNIVAPYKAYVFSCYRKGNQILPSEWAKDWNGDKWEKILKEIKNETN